MKSRAQRRIGTIVSLPGGRVGTIVDTASQERQPIVKVKWADDSTVSWHRPDELTRE